MGIRRPHRAHVPVPSSARPPDPGGGLTRRQVLLGSLAAAGGVATVGALGGCSPAAVAAGGAVPLSYWHLLSGGDGIVMANLVEEVNAMGHGYDATQTVLAWGAPYYTKLAMASVGGRAPDVAVMHASRVAGYAPGGLLDPWDLDLLADVGVQEGDFLERVWQKGTLDGNVYSIALDSHPFILMYNTDVAAQAGALGPDGRLVPIEDPETFLEVARAMQAVTGGHGVAYGYLGDGAQMWRLFYTFYKQHGADFDLSGDKAKVDVDAAVSSLEYIQRMLDGTVATPNGDYGTAVSEFASAEAGMFLTGVWELPTMKAAGFGLDAQPIPTLFGTPAAYADSHAFTLPHQNDPDPEHRRATYEFVADLLKNSLPWAEAGHIPAFQPVVESEDYAQLTPQANYAPAAEILNYDPEAWFTGSGSDFQNYFLETVQNVFLQGADPREGFEAFVRRIDVQLAKPNPV
ncbi:extracellular solute-binding protein [Cellulomonas sp. JZ18]|uniref:extracellular solute-binding protein n=1 Tax=Cellulomonas sp. JZ18 TaxID=2654191 RepID=UPI0012D47268|nr:extracellular solute-binding protein [Cellulomonas sp. JZ18]QGQ18386.1 extracellular solute-binding protein [Cellulomonas sp. JZ18]